VSAYSETGSKGLKNSLKQQMQTECRQAESLILCRLSLVAEVSQQKINK
jgi:hypothetical protein